MHFCKNKTFRVHLQPFMLIAGFIKYQNFRTVDIVLILRIICPSFLCIIYFNRPPVKLKTIKIRWKKQDVRISQTPNQMLSWMRLVKRRMGNCRRMFGVTTDWSDLKNKRKQCAVNIILYIHCALFNKIVRQVDHFLEVLLNGAMNKVKTFCSQYLPLV